MSALEFFKYFLVMLSAFSVVSTMGMALAGVLVDKQPLAYTFLGAASGSAVLSSFIIALVAVVMIRGIEGRGPQGREEEAELEKGLPGKEFGGVLHRGGLERELSEDLAVIQGTQEELTMNGGQHSHSTDTQFERQTSTERRQLGVRGFFVLFLAILLGELAPISVLWALGFAVTSATHDNSSLPIYTYVLTDMLTGIVPPMLIIMSSTLGMMFVDYAGSGKVDIRDLIAKCLPSVSLFKGTTHDYWIIVNTFYFATKKAKAQKHWHPSYFKSCVTLELTIIVSVILLQAFMTFASLTVSNLEVFDSCQKATDNPQLDKFTCYLGETWQHVSCPQNSTSHIYCFRFVSVRVVVELVPGILVSAIAVTVGHIELFELIFKAVKVLLRCKSGKVWGATATLVGVIVLLGGPVQLFLMFKFPVHYKPTGAIQTGLFGVYITTIGLLLIKVKWWERPKEEKEEVELVSVGTRKPKQFGEDKYARSRITRRAKEPDNIKQTNYPLEQTPRHWEYCMPQDNLMQVALNTYTAAEEGNDIYSA